ncbi:hypothetical protein ACFQ3P_38450 [Paraburkholderia sabiae]|uniref:Uncharacterized protein n=1 Tax=Paraburkholderia sabiae TaxID=273251 RepID=A0ABU9QPZ5_9BURK|nr:hypothetical protein [Paraburkholderia sabiae]WJZ74405.1 hypothetical protein QEN71_00910 [Paraburkholderia sabiae]CAD6562630.1 hypothetical protein LMG24235_07869 [Paraburkholderia sabiae]
MFVHHHPGRPSALTGRLGALTLAALVCLSPAAIEKTARAATISSEIQISLTIRDVCTMNTDDATPQVACSAGAPFRVYRGNYFASATEPRSAVFATASRDGSVEIAF